VYRPNGKILGKKEDYQYFMKRSQNWKNLYNPKTALCSPEKRKLV
jgi:putative alpha-1,2-mannosidase